MLDKINIGVALLSAFLLLSGVWLIPSWILWIILCISCGLSVFHYLNTRKQPYIHMVAVAFYLSGLIGVWIHTFWIERALPIQPLTVMRMVYVLFLLLLIGLIFVYWRALSAFQHKRGNVDKEKLVSSNPTLFERWKDRKRTPKGDGGIYVILGDEIKDKN